MMGTMPFFCDAKDNWALRCNQGILSGRLHRWKPEQPSAVKYIVPHPFMHGSMHVLSLISLITELCHPQLTGKELIRGGSLNGYGPEYLNQPQVLPMYRTNSPVAER